MVDLSKQQKLNAVPKVIQQIDCNGNIEKDTLRSELSGSK